MTSTTDFQENPLGQSRTAAPMFEASGLNPSAKGWSTREVSNLLISLIKTAPHLLASSGFLHVYPAIIGVCQLLEEYGLPETRTQNLAIKNRLLSPLS
jgi:hypothetical protein